MAVSCPVCLLPCEVWALCNQRLFDPVISGPGTGLWRALGSPFAFTVVPAAGALAGRQFPSSGDSCSCQPLAQGHGPLGQPLSSAWCLGVGVEQGNNSEAPEVPAVGQAAGCPQLASQLSPSLPAQVLTPRAFLTNILQAVLPFRACFLGCWPTERKSRRELLPDQKGSTDKSVRFRSHPTWMLTDSSKFRSDLLHPRSPPLHALAGHRGPRPEPGGQHSWGPGGKAGSAALGSFILHWLSLSFLPITSAKSPTSPASVLSGFNTWRPSSQHGRCMSLSSDLV